MRSKSKYPVILITQEKWDPQALPTDSILAHLGCLFKNSRGTL